MLAMLPVAEKLRDEENTKPVFFLFRKGRFNSEHYRMIERLDIEWMEPDALAYLPRERDFSLGKKFSKLLPGGLGSLWMLGLHYKRLLHMAKSVLQRESVCALVLMGDRHVGWETSLIAQANKIGVPSLIVPFAASGPKGGALFRLKKGDDLAMYQVRGVMNRLSAGLYPEWVYEYDGQRLLFYPGSNALVARIMGIMPDKPWTLLGGSATCAAVENRILFDRFIEQGVSRDKMVITGHPQLDASIKYLNDIDISQKRDELRANGEQRLIVFAIPHMAEHALLPWDQHMKLIEYTIERIRQFEDYCLVLNLHPKSDRSRYEYLENKYGIAISLESVYSLIPLCDVFMAAHSSTVMQAIGLRKPSIVLDYFGIGADMYGDAPGVALVNITEHPNTLSNELERLLRPSFLAELHQKQSCESNNWIIYDGRSTDRVVEQLLTLISVHETRSAA